MKLLSMTDFIEKSRDEMTSKSPLNFSDTKKYFDRIFNYSDFLKQPLELWMFVPCDENGNTLESPYKDNFIQSNGSWINKGSWNQYSRELDEYVKAKERILFKDFEPCITNNVQSVHSNSRDVHFQLIEKKSIESIATGRIELTETAIKQIGL